MSAQSSFWALLLTVFLLAATQGPAAAKQSASGVRVGGGQTLPIVIAVAILVVVLAGIPLAILRRRSNDG